METKLVRMAYVLNATGLSRSSIYKFQAEGSFPASIKIGKRAMAWDASLIHEWVSSRILAARKAQQGAEAA